MSSASRTRPHVLGRYTIESEIARGGMATVYRAIDGTTNRLVALKRLHPGVGERSAKLFQREYHTLVQLEHPRIVEVYDYGVDADGAYYTMQLLDGADLRELAPLPFQEACRHLRDLASSLALIHARRFLHRDLSPRNVRIAGDGRAKLLDFGALATFGVNRQVVGTPPVVPPEALYGLELDQRSDLYGLGALAYWVLTRQHAYAARTLKALPRLWRAGPPPPPSSLVAEIPPELDVLVLSLLNQDVIGRPRSAADVIEELNAIAGLEPDPSLDVGASYLENPRIVGRTAELRRIGNLVANLSETRGAGLVVTGPPGVGRTRLLAEAALSAQVGGATIARVDAEVHPEPHGTMRGLLLELSRKLPDVGEAARPHAAWLCHILPELREAAGNVPLAKLPQDLAERRIRLQESVLGFLKDISAEHVLVLAVDNAHAADEGSLATLAVLLRSGASRRLGVWLTVRDGDVVAEPDLLGRLTAAYPHIALEGLDSEATGELARALFGDVEHAGRLGQWLHDSTGGNPRHCLALASELVGAGLAQYRDGAWVLPAEQPAELSDTGYAALNKHRLGRLSPGARQLAESLSIEEGQLDLALCLELAQMRDDQAFSALAELVSSGVVVISDDEYRFGHQALRRHLSDRLTEDRKRRLHLRAAGFHLRREVKDPMVKIAAGWHLLRGGEALRGAELLEAASQRLLSSVEGLRIAAPALEAALEVYEKEKKSPWVLLPVLNALTAVGWYVDHRYFEQYGERTLDLTLELTGLTLARKLARTLGKRRGLKVALGIAVARHAAQKRHIRGKQFKRFDAVFQPLLNTVGIMVGVAATLQSGSRARRILTKCEMMGAFEPGHVVAVMYEYATYYTLTAEGRIEEAGPYGSRVLEWFATEKAAKMLGPGTKALSGGIMAGISQFAAFRDDTDPEYWPERLDALGLSFYRLMATQARWETYAARGKSEQARLYREQLELEAMKGGTTWQSSILTPIVQGPVAARAEDLQGLRQVVDALEQRAQRHPVLASYAQVFQANWELLRGRKREALTRIDAVLPELGRWQWIWWVLTQATRARALIGLGRVREAREALSEIQSGLVPGDEGVVLMNLDAQLLEAEIAMAEGEHQRAWELYDAMLDRHLPHEGPLTLCRIFESRARLAAQLEDEARFDEAVSELEHWANKSENPVLLVKAKRLEGAARRTFHRAPPSGRRLLPRPSSMASVAQDLLENKRGQDAIRAALRIALDLSGAAAGHLYVGSSRDLRLEFSLPETEPIPNGITEELLAIAEHANRGGSVLLEATATLGAMARTVTKEVGDNRIDLLSIPGQNESLVVVGALVLRPPSSGGLTPLGVEVLETIARAISDVGTHGTTMIGRDDEAMFEDG